ncbi:MAG TPA: single-stranded-DNA-specific exonuclease RecJ, partial [Feifaniaceae bacterium]|nr:single-stranded-DNA-specific exonuclease RecJ [Feifaniaceae bacterium]
MLRFEPFSREDTAHIARIAEENGISALLASLLFHRGILERGEVAAFLHPGPEQLCNPFLLDDMRAAVARIHTATAQKERICVYGDYDADGVCSTAMLVSYLRAQDADVIYYLPSRHTEGYGMNVEALKSIASESVQLIVTVDNGIAAKSEVALCRELGMDVIITDHHQCPEELPECTAVVNPHRQGSAYPNPDLCGAGVAFKLIQALGAAREQLKSYLPLAALATVADIVPLRNENRAIVSMGLPLVPGHMGLNALLAVSGSAGQEITSEVLAFRLAPRINAAGRMGDAARALLLLMAEEEERAKELALILNEENERRQDEERGILQQARRMLEGKNTAAMRAILLYSPDWSPGVIGIVASKLVEEYNRPVLLFHLSDDGLLTGSCRSIPKVHLYDCLSAFSGMFLRFGGHAQAAGLTMEFRKFHEFSAAFDAYLRKTYPASVFVPSAKYECALGLPELTLQNTRELALLAPYGEGNPQPVFLARNIGLTDVETMGRDGAHLKASAEQGGRTVRLVAFGRGGDRGAYTDGGRFHILYTPEANVWQQKARLQLMLRAIKPVSPFEDPQF